jgi:hypothetical protein
MSGIALGCFLVEENSANMVWNRSNLRMNLVE